MAAVAAPGRIDLLVAHQALGHTREEGAGHLVGFKQAVMACPAGLVFQGEMQRVVEVRDWRRGRRPQVQNRPAMAIEAGVGGERRLPHGWWLRAFGRPRMAAHARQPHGQMRPVPEIVWLRQKRGCRRHNRRKSMNDRTQYIDDDSNHRPAISLNRQGENFVFWFGGPR